jgi:hypothetical protein
MIFRRIMTACLSAVLVFALIGPPISASAMNGSPAAMSLGQCIHDGGRSPVKGVSSPCSTAAGCVSQASIQPVMALLTACSTVTLVPYAWAATGARGQAVEPEIGPPKQII